jgi:poly(3-hydroxybutyrate) depolymerase
MYTLEAYTELDRTADQNGFIVAYLEADWRDFGAQSGGWVWAWYVYADAPYNEWTPAGDWTADPDVDFVRKLAARLESQYNIDKTRIYAAGHSRGAGEAIILAYELPNLIAGYDCESGFADVNAFQQVMAAYAGPKIPAVIVHGKIDDNVPFASGQAIASTLTKSGYVEGQDFLFFALDAVPHRWQVWLNQQMWDFLSSHPMPLGQVKP